MSQALLDLELSKLSLDYKLGDFPPRILRPLLLQLTSLHDFGISTICKSSLLVLKQVFAKQQILHQKVIDLADNHLRNIFNDTSAKTYYFLCFLCKPRKNWIYQQIPRSLINSAIVFLTNLLSRVISMTYSSNVPRYQILVPFEKSITVIATTSQILGFRSSQFHTQDKIIIQAIIETLGKKLENIQRSQDSMQNLVNTQAIISPIQQLQQITKESPGSDSIINKNFLPENHSYVSQLQDKANKLERKYQKVKQKLNEQHEAHYTELEYNNIEKILELVLPVNFPDLFDLDQPIDWDDFIRVMGIESLKIPWIYLQSQGYRRTTYSQLLIQLDVRIDLTDYQLDEMFKPFNEDPKQDQAWRFIPQIAFASGNTTLARSLLEFSQRICRVDSNFYTLSKLYVSIILQCIDSLQDTSNPDKINKSLTNNHTLKLLKDCSSGISSSVNHLGAQNFDLLLAKTLSADKRMRDSEYYDLTSQTFDTELLKT